MEKKPNKDTEIKLKYKSYLENFSNSNKTSSIEEKINSSNLSQISNYKKSDNNLNSTYLKKSNKWE